MENYLAVIACIVMLLVGGAIGATGFSDTEVVTVDKVVIQEKLVEVPCPVVECPTLTEVTCESAKVEVSTDSILNNAVAEFMQSVDDEEDEAGNDVEVFNGKYDFDEIEVSKLYKDYTVEVSDNGDVTTVEFSIRLKGDQEDEQSEKETYDVRVVYEEDEDTTVEIL